MSMGPIQAERRHQAIAAIHAYADWLTANPDVPVPDEVHGSVHPHDISRAASIKVANNLVDQHAGEALSGGSSDWATAPVIAEPIRIKHTIFLAHERPARRDWR